MTDTIFALSSGQPPAGIAVVRLSGPAAFAAIETLAGSLPPPRRASLRILSHNGDALDRALVLIFPGPNTATGEDLAELHLHGGRAVVRAVEGALRQLPGLRPAEGGEFTRRALANGRIDLTEAEGLGDLLAAESESQRRAAMRAAEGGIRRLVEGWATRTIALSAAVEAMLDHADEEDVMVEGEQLATIVERSTALAQEIDHIVAQPGVERLRDGIRVVLAGPPNAGKSTLLNTLVGRDAAIVSSIAGTTRDRIEVPVSRDGVSYLFVDTAGLHDAPSDPVEAIGIDRARQSIDMADLVLWLDDAPPGPAVDADSLIKVHARADVRGPAKQTDRISVSAATGEGIASLWDALAMRAAAILPAADTMPLNLRQRDLAAAAANALHELSAFSDPILMAEQLRSATEAFHRITGRADVEAMLDALFSRFCIGK